MNDEAREQLRARMRKRCEEAGPPPTSILCWSTRGCEGYRKDMPHDAVAAADKIDEAEQEKGTE